MAGQRILIAKVGLDGHDRGIKVVARICATLGTSDYTGRFQTPATLRGSGRRGRRRDRLSCCPASHDAGAIVIAEVRERVSTSRDRRRHRAGTGHRQVEEAGVAAVLTPERIRPDRRRSRCSPCRSSDGDVDGEFDG